MRRSSLSGYGAVVLLASVLLVAAAAFGESHPAIVKNETILQHAPGNYMQVRHVVLKGANEQIGEALAYIARKEYGTTLSRSNE